MGKFSKGQYMVLKADSLSLKIFPDTNFLVVTSKMKQNTLLKDNYLYYCNTWPLGLSMALFIIHPASVSTWVSNLEALRLFNNSNRGVCQLTTVLFLFQPSVPIISPNMVICLAMQDISVKHLIWSCSLPPNIFVFARLQVWPDLEMASKKKGTGCINFIAEL